MSWSMSQRFRIDALTAEGFSKRTIYSWTNKGILPPAISHDASGFNYTHDHIRIVREIKRFLESQRTLAEYAEVLRQQYPQAYGYTEDAA